MNDLLMQTIEAISELYRVLVIVMLVSSNCIHLYCPNCCKSSYPVQTWCRKCNTHEDASDKPDQQPELAGNSGFSSENRIKSEDLGFVALVHRPPVSFEHNIIFDLT